MWYGLKIGLDYKTAHIIPLTELFELTAIEQIKHEGAEMEVALTDDEIIPDLR